MERSTIKTQEAMKIGYTAKSKCGEVVEFYAHTTETAEKLGTLSAYHWIVNHLDTSKRWDYFPNGKFKHD